MHARVSTYAGPEGSADEAIRAFESVTDPLKGLDGFERAYLLVDRDSGKAITMTLWASDEAAEASAEAAKQMRGQAAGSAGLSIESVETYEVAMQVEPGG